MDAAEVEQIRKDVDDLDGKYGALSARVDAAFITIASHHEQNQAGHKRLRDTITELKDEANESNDAYNREIREIRKSLTEISAKLDSPIDVGRLVIGPRIVVAIVSAVVAIILGAYGVTSGVRSDVRDINTMMIERKDVERAQNELRKNEMEALKSKVDEYGREQRLKQYDYQSLEKAILSLKGKKP